MAAPKKYPKVKQMIMHQGCDLVGSVRSFKYSRNTELEELPHGIRMTSLKTRRKVTIPFSNIQGYETFFEDESAT